MHTTEVLILVTCYQKFIEPRPIEADEENNSLTFGVGLHSFVRCAEVILFPCNALCTS